MATPSRARTNPCAQCRATEKHLKCDTSIPCANCRRISTKCVRIKRFHMRRLITTENAFKFDPNQTWSQYSIQAPEQRDPFANIVQADDTFDHTRVVPKPFPFEGAQKQVGLDIAACIAHAVYRGRSRELNGRRKPSTGETAEGKMRTSDATRLPNHDEKRPGSSLNPSVLSKLSTTQAKSSSAAHLKAAPDFSPVSISKWKHASPDAALMGLPEFSSSFYDSCTSQSFWHWENSPQIGYGEIRGAKTNLRWNSPGMSLEEACLIRCFVENLARVFDATDRNHHFASLPSRAMHSPLLLNAIFAASTKFLTRTWSLRVRLAGNDNETFTKSIHAIFQASQRDSDGLSSFILQPSRVSLRYATPPSSLRHSACLLALRQEIWSVLAHGRPFRLPILAVDNSGIFDDSTAADDYDWTNRVLIWCAHVLRFCFPADETCHPRVEEDKGPRAQQLEDLKLFQRNWDERRPSSFEPFYYRERNPAEGRYFPDIWVTSGCKVLALQHVELARIVLAVRDFKPQLGAGARYAREELEKLLLHAIRRICGLAMSQQWCQEGMVTAAVGLIMCGEYFQDEGERGAIIDLISILEHKYAWCTGALSSAVWKAWSLVQDS